MNHLDKNYIIVSGEPRSGTSMMMQTLQCLGIPIWGNEFPTPHAEMRGLNPKGFYETQHVSTGLELEHFEQFAEVAKEMSSPIWRERACATLDKSEEFNHGAIKLITNALMMTDKCHFNKIILCLRHPRDIAHSQTELRAPRFLDEDEQKEFRWEYKTNRYIFDMSRFVFYLHNNEDVIEKILPIQYEGMHTNTIFEVNKICAFLDIDPNVNQINNAIGNVDPGLRRKSNAPELPGKSWDMAIKIYKHLSVLDVDGIFEEVQDYVKNHKHTWIDEETWSYVDEDQYNQLQEDQRFLQELIEIKDKNASAGKLCISCPHFKRSKFDYIVYKKDDVEVKRKKVNCSDLDLELTLEQCQEHWDHINNG